MAFIPYFVGPTFLLGVIGLLHGPDKTIPTPAEDWRLATMDLLIPTFNEEKTIVLCLASILRQTLQPRQIILYDDASTDKTVEYAKAYARLKNIELHVLTRAHNEGKTPSVYYAAHESDADVLAVVDGDTILKSDNYLERLVQELYQGVGIACACGMVYPLTDQSRFEEYEKDHVEAFAAIYPDAEYSLDKTGFQKFQRFFTNSYREELYLFLQRSIYRGEMVFFGTLIFPIGCAVTYRREYLKDILDYYLPSLGYDLTASEDIFFGFAFAEKGYRNIVTQDVVAFTTEPRFFRIFHQIFKWSSSFLQCCYYFDDLFFTPFKFPRYLIKKIKDQHNYELKKAIDKRKIKEAYRQVFGREPTKKYGRHIGWFIFTSACEKVTFPCFILIFMILQYWTPLLITLCAEVALYTVTISFMHKNRRIRNCLKAICFSPIRYMQIMFDLVVIGNFVIDLWLTKNRAWRK